MLAPAFAPRPAVCRTPECEDGVKLRFVNTQPRRWFEAPCEAAAPARPRYQGGRRGTVLGRPGAFCDDCSWPFRGIVTTSCVGFGAGVERKTGDASCVPQQARRSTHDHEDVEHHEANELLARRGGRRGRTHARFRRKTPARRRGRFLSFAQPRRAPSTASRAPACFVRRRRRRTRSVSGPAKRPGRPAAPGGPPNTRTRTPRRLPGWSDGPGWRRASRTSGIPSSP